MQTTAHPGAHLRRISRLAALFGVLASAACQSVSTNIVEPSKSKCDIAVKNNTSEIPASGGTGTITVSTTRDCVWNASSAAPWISLAMKEGQGPATVNYSASANPNGIVRRTSVVVAEQTIEIAQAAAECRFQTTPSSVNVEPGGTSVSIAMTVPSGCRWDARSDVPWIASVAPASGEGGATVHVTVAPNTADARTGAVEIGTATVRFAQAAAQPPSAPPAPGEPPPPPPPPTCNFAVSPTEQSASAAGGQIAITVTAAAGCSWTATTTAAWIAIASGATGSGNGSVQLTVSSNNAAARTGTATIAGRAVTISQAAAPPPPPPPPPACTYRLSDPTRNVVADGQDVTVNVDAPAGCAWTVTSGDAWITIADPGTGTGNGSVRLTVGRNSGAARTGTVRIATETLTVQQAAAPVTCTYQIAPASYDAGRGSETVTITVTADSACAWTTMTDATWVVIDTGQTGTGNGAVRLIVSANTGPERTAVVTIAGHPFMLRQASGCSATIKPASYDAGRGPDDIKVSVTIDPGCTWIAASDVSWVVIAEGSTGTGNGDVRLLVQENTGALRSVTLTIAGRPFALTQQGP